MGRENVMEVKFYDTVNDELLKFAVIISQSNGKWVFCKHKERDTYEVPGGHRETGENILETAKRELQEETGAVKYEIKPICVYSVTGKTRVNDTGEESFGMLYFAEITEFAKELHSEMEKVILMDELPENWTYPLIQPKLIEKYLQIEKQSYSRIQLAAKQTIEYIKNTIKPGMNLLEIRKLCEEKLLELGADSFWYWDVGAFVFAGDETTVSVSGKQYVTSDRVIGNNDIITIDLMLMYSKEANNRKQEIDRQHHTIPNQRANDKHHGNVYNLLFRYGKVRSQNMEKLKSSFPTFCKRTFPQLHKIASYAHYAQCRLLRKPSHFIIYSRK